MKNLTLHFHSLKELAGFSKQINCGYFLNTINLTITGKLPTKYIDLATRVYNANIIATTSKRYSWVA